MMTLKEYEAKVAENARYAVGDRVRFDDGCYSAFNGVTATVEKVDLDHTHGGSREFPWWARHDPGCFKGCVEYSLVINPRPDGSADWRWRSPAKYLTRVR